MEYKILKAYRDKSSNLLLGITGIAGVACIAVGVATNSTSRVIAGASFYGIASFGFFLEYAKAYMEARLDYLKNSKFTKLEEKVKEP